MTIDEQLDFDAEQAIQCKGPMTEERQRLLIDIGHRLLDRVEQNFNFMFDAIKKKKGESVAG